MNAGGRITTLVENVVYQEGLAAEHGLSILVEWNGRSVLFDFGQTGLFLQNAARLGIDLGKVETCVVSHGHYDHTGGLSKFLLKYPRTQVWMRESALEPKASTRKKTVGIPEPEQLDRDRFQFSQGLTEITEGVYLLPPPPLVYPEDFHGEGMFVRRDGTWISDDFQDEQSLVLKGEDSITLVSACSHRGILNIIEAASQAFGLPIDLVVGGFHLRDADQPNVDSLISRLNERNIRRIGICHCTGVEHLGRLQVGLTAEVFYNHSGRVITF